MVRGTEMISGDCWERRWTDWPKFWEVEWIQNKGRVPQVLSNTLLCECMSFLSLTGKAGL